MNTVSRRRFVAAAAALGAAFAACRVVPRETRIASRERRDLYPEGVASGDPEPDSVLLWTRRPFFDGRLAAQLRVEVSEDETFGRVIASAPARVSAASDWTCRVLVGGLAPSRICWYRFTDDEGFGSRAGRTSTAPAHDDPRAVRFAFVSCQNANQGAQNAYRRMILRRRRMVVGHRKRGDTCRARDRIRCRIAEASLRRRPIAAGNTPIERGRRLHGAPTLHGAARGYDARPRARGGNRDGVRDPGDGAGGRRAWHRLTGHGARANLVARRRCRVTELVLGVQAPAVDGLARGRSARVVIAQRDGSGACATPGTWVGCATGVPLGGLPVWPNVLSPQHQTAPVVSTRQAKAMPAEIVGIAYGWTEAASMTSAPASPLSVPGATERFCHMHGSMRRHAGVP